MSVKLLRNYQTYLANAVVTFPTDTESALIQQGIAVASTPSSIKSNVGAPDAFGTFAGNVVDVLQSGAGGLNVGSTLYQGPVTWPCIPMGAAALTGFETNGTAPVAGTINLTEVYVPYAQTWTGVGVLNGTVVGTDNFIVMVYGNDGTLLANSALAGTLSAGASAFQNIAFTTPVTLLPGRYYLGVQSNGTTATLRHLLSANGATNCTSATAGVFGTLPATITVPNTFTTAVGVITQLYV